MSDEDFSQAHDWIRFEQASSEDAAALTEAQARAFHADVGQVNNQDFGCPEGIDSVEWQVKMMRRGHYYKILSGERIIGGFIVIRLSSSRYELGRLWIEPEFQNRGIGSMVLQYIEDLFPARRWTLDTPSWAKRNQHFYEKMGYRKVGEVNAGDGMRYLYEKRI